MNRGDVYWYDGRPTVTESSKKKCPVVILSRNAANRQLNNPYVTVVPTTTNVAHIYPLEVDLGEYLYEPSKAQPQYIFTCRKADLSPEPIIALPEKLVEAIQLSLRVYLTD